MTTHDAIVDAADETTVRTSLKLILNTYLSPAFSALPKKEIDLAILVVLQELQFVSDEPTVYELVNSLRVTKAKARNLLYDQSLRRLDAAKLDDMVVEALKNPLLQKQGELFVLEIDNPLLLDHLQAKVRELGHASDGSFSPSLVKLSLDAVAALIEDHLAPSKRTIVKRALVKAGAPDRSVKGAIKGALMQIGKKVASDAGESIAEGISGYLGPILDGVGTKITSLMKPLFAAAKANS